MEAVLRVQSSEFTDELISKITVLLSGTKNTEITISITEKQLTGILREETREQYFSRLDNSIENLKKRMLSRLAVIRLSCLQSILLRDEEHYF